MRRNEKQHAQASLRDVRRRHARNLRGAAREEANDLRSYGGLSGAEIHVYEPTCGQAVYSVVQSPKTIAVIPLVVRSDSAKGASAEPHWDVEAPW